MSLGGQSQQGAPQLTSSNTAGNSSQNGTSTTATGPWAPQQGYVQGGFANAANLENAPQTLPTSPLLQASWTDMTNAADNTPAFLSQGNSYLSNVLSGANLSPNSNPYLAQSVQAAEQPLINNYQTAIAPQTASSSEMANRYGSGEANQRQTQDQTTLATALGNTSANMYTSAYNQGIQQQESAAGQIPGQLAANYAPSLLENQAGQQAQQLQQLQQQYPWLTAQQYQQIVGGNYGQSGTTTQNQTGTTQGTMTGQASQPYYSNPLGSIFGGTIGLLGAAGQAGGSAGIAGLLPAAAAVGSGTLF